MHLSPGIALCLTVALIAFLFRRDIRERPNVTSALWLPLLWMLLIGSRSPVQWLALGGYIQGGSMEEGNLLDAIIYFVLIVVGMCVLSQRQVQLSEVIRNNAWLVVFLLYCCIAIAWSDFPLVSFKRWIKIAGHPIMALILFTEPNPEKAFTTLMKRSAYVLVPFSILLIKYYENLGRGFDVWTGAASNNGVNLTKNELGCVCMILGFFFFWYLLQTLKMQKGRGRRNELCLIGTFLFMIGWLLVKAHSATSTMCLLLGVVIVTLLGMPFVNRRLIGRYVIFVIIGLIVAELTFGIFGRLVDLTGHEATLNGRAELWRECLASDGNPIFGVGFESFWLGERLRTLSAAHWWHPTEAHNGYLETYLDLGLLGLFLLAGLILATFRKTCRELLTNFEWGRFRLGFLTAIIVYNWTEAAFKGLSPLWFVFYIIALDYPSSEWEREEQYAKITSSEEEMELARVSGVWT